MTTTPGPRIAADAAMRDFYRGRRILIAGGDGFLGRTAAIALAALGADTTILARSQRRADQQAPGRRVTADLADPAVAHAAAEGQSIVLDFIGATSAVDSNRDPASSLLGECLPHLNLLAACAAQREKPLVVFPSSRLVYGRPERLPVDETHPTRPLNIYGVHKLAVEGYLSVYRETRGVPYQIFRISNPYGPHQSAANKGYGIVNYFIQLAARGAPIRIFGDGSQLRDYVFADDLIEMVLRAAAEPTCRDQVFNLGGSEGVSLRRVAELIVAAAGGTPLEFVPWPPEHRAVETGDYVSAVDKLVARIGRPEPTPMVEGLRRAIAAYRG